MVVFGLRTTLLAINPRIPWWQSFGGALTNHSRATVPWLNFVAMVRWVALPWNFVAMVRWVALPCTRSLDGSQGLGADRGETRDPDPCLCPLSRPGQPYGGSWRGWRAEGWGRGCK